MLMQRKGGSPLSSYPLSGAGRRRPVVCAALGVSTGALLARVAAHLILVP